MRSNRKRFGFLLCCMLTVVLAAGCSVQEGGTVWSMEMPSLNDERSYDIYLNQGEDYLDLQGMISLDTGSVSIKIIGAESGEVFYQQKAAAGQREAITIKIDDFKDESELKLVITGDQARMVRVELFSDQKLVKAAEKPRKGN